MWDASAQGNRPEEELKFSEENKVNKVAFSGVVVTSLVLCLVEDAKQDFLDELINVKISFTVCVADQLEKKLNFV